MTTANTAAKTPPSPAPGPFRLPEPPPREPDEMTSYDHVHKPGNSHHLIQHLGNPDTTLVAAERWIAPAPHSGAAGRRRPDLLIAFNVNPAAYEASNGYIISEQGKPPDFVLEVASRSTADVDVGEKRQDYAALGIPEYWRFDETGEYHGARLAGDRLGAGQYQPIPIAELAGGVLQGYSAVLNLYLRWEGGRLGWHDPATGRHIATFEDERARAEDERARAEDERARAEDERARAEDERARADGEREARLYAEARADGEREARLQAEARVRALEAELARLQSNRPD